jgi:hypothetical protein
MCNSVLTILIIIMTVHIMSQEVSLGGQYTHRAAAAAQLYHIHGFLSAGVLTNVRGTYRTCLAFGLVRRWCVKQTLSSSTISNV